MFKLILFIVIGAVSLSFGFMKYNSEIAGFFVEKAFGSRPELLKDASRDDEKSAVAFHQRFPDGTPEHELTSWLTANKFEISDGNAMRRAKLHLPDRTCGEDIKLLWHVNDYDEIHNMGVSAEQSPCF